MVTLVEDDSDDEVGFSINPTKPEKDDLDRSTPTGTGTGTGLTVEEMISKEEEVIKKQQAETLKRSGLPFFNEDESVDELIERLRSKPSFNQKFLREPDFLERIQELKKHPEKISQFMSDPRVMQAFCCLQGMGLNVSEQDLQKAEREGHMSDRPVISAQEKDGAQQYSTVADAKAAGNASFKAGELRAALALYERARELAEGVAPSDEVIPIISNIALVFIKLTRFKDAEAACTQAIDEVPKDDLQRISLTKVFFRRSLARERQKQLTEALSDMEQAATAAAEDVRREVQRIQNTGSMLARRQPYTQAAVKSLQIEVTRLQKEVARLKELALVEAKNKASSEERRREERDLGALRSSGQALPSQPTTAKQVPAPYAPGVVAEQDWSFWAKNRLSELLVGSKEVKGAEHWMPDGGVIRVHHLDLAKSEVHASVKLKKGKRALYYDLDISCQWEAVSNTADGTTKSSQRSKLAGIFRLYNVSQETQYCPGGSQNSSYIYSIGYDPRNTSNWAMAVKEEAQELFHAVSEKVGKLILELQRK
ncbi:hypothetical protein CYMTET_53861 [Cymbomonas tetramitiformis]|uniref:Uncharacterized protein n=1 Tax=Cymbomonas tetramitiformis TaxID=36881 RepID=A0AAE0EPB3_9CHLO|nr:hypothetical protein CYMTET_53861 [Cymbomonas tetramitiformis]